MNTNNFMIKKILYSEVFITGISDDYWKISDTNLQFTSDIQAMILAKTVITVQCMGKLQLV